MARSNITLIAAVDKTGGIGFEGKIPWRIPGDLAHFKKMTKGHCVVMGRATAESLPRPLPSRWNVLVTRNQDAEANRFWTNLGYLVRHDLETFLKEEIKQGRDDELFIIGGRQIYEQALPYATRLVLTRVYNDFECDTFFPQVPSYRLEEVTTLKHFDASDHPLMYRISDYRLGPHRIDQC